MNNTSFFNYIQPTIVKLNDNVANPEHLRNHYLVNMNVVGVPYFFDMFLLIKNGHSYEYMLTNKNEKIRLTDNIEQIDIPRIYLAITDKLTVDDTYFQEWLTLSLIDNAVYYNGTDNFVPGVDYWLNKTAYDALLIQEEQVCEPDPSRLLHDYLNGDYEVTQYWEALDDKLKYYSNFRYFQNKNENMDTNQFSEDELDNLYSTFCGIILSQTTITDNKLAETMNNIYKRVLEYYRGFQSDSTSAGLAVILGTDFAALPEYASVTSCGCGGSSATSTSMAQSGSTQSCASLYSTAMTEYLSKMLGDTQFYKDWMWIENNENNFSNDGLINNLITLLEEFESTEYDLSFSESKPIYWCNCGNSSTNNITDKCNHEIIQNYIKVLNWVKDGYIDENTNKIRVYGTKFAELLPKLIF